MGQQLLDSLWPSRLDVQLGGLGTIGILTHLDLVLQVWLISTFKVKFNFKSPKFLMSTPISQMTAQWYM